MTTEGNEEGVDGAWNSDVTQEHFIIVYKAAQ